ncbi:type VI secretion system protein TssA [Dyella acidiphila]|uniref:Type VI secretion system protein TssA n=1 Tax=Dyella acidiphila TaxID=2775866 RepID=A0ABR9GAM0_9GAMM|nr:type VI secretion system protein TssA [Dyella acidiphila]MBE1161087.1 type VI secretion system protein TssA [Dyella acidiphila]
MIDIEALLEPISADAPCGDDLSFSAEFDAIQEARRSDDASLDQGQWVTDLKTSDWFSVSRQCGTLLRTRSKDLRLAVWLAEASARMDGFAGLAAGYRLVAGLCDRYWDSIHPQADGDDHELRVGNLSWLLTQSIQWARSIPLTNASQGRYDAIALEMAARGLSGDGQSDYPDNARIDAARAATPFEFYQQLAEQAPQVLEALKALESVVDARLGAHGPSFTAARDAVGDVVRSALRMASTAGVTSLDASAPPPLPGNNSAVEAVPAPAPAASGVSGEIANRREALLLLRRVADFFRRTEPHSPVAYLADKAARWGNMPLHVWLKTVVKDNNALSQLEDLLDVGTDESRNG